MVNNCVFTGLMRYCEILFQRTKYGNTRRRLRFQERFLEWSQRKFGIISTCPMAPRGVLLLTTHCSRCCLVPNKRNSCLGYMLCIYGLMQEKRNFSMLALEFRPSWTNPSICTETRSVIWHRTRLVKLTLKLDTGRVNTTVKLSM